MANLNPTFKKELNGKTIKVAFDDSFRLTPYELNQIRFWLNLKKSSYILPEVLPVSKRFVLDFTWHDVHALIVLRKFKKNYFR